MFDLAVDLRAFQNATVSVIAFATSLFIILLAVRIPFFAGGYGNLMAVQAMHTRPTPRLGGLAIFTAIVASLPLAPPEIADRYGKFILATGVLFAVGLAEDLGLGVTPRKRLAAVIVASLLVVVMLDVQLPRTDIPLLDLWMDEWLLAIPLTLLVTAGVANGFNLIDGVNGLAALTAIVAATALALIADAGGYGIMVHLAMMLVAAVLGFMLLNYPFGLIFLGDAGAYVLGFVISWFAIAVLNKVPEASAWAMLLVVFWPVADTVLAIWRRTRRQALIMGPDRLHFHQLVMRALEIHFVGRGRRHIANPLTTLILAPMIILPPVAGVLFWNQPLAAFLSVVFFAALFVVIYMAAYPIMGALKRAVGRRDGTDDDG